MIRYRRYEIESPINRLPVWKATYDRGRMHRMRLCRRRYPNSHRRRSSTTHGRPVVDYDDP